MDAQVEGRVWPARPLEVLQALEPAPLSSHQAIHRSEQETCRPEVLRVWP